jgi:hypothetical protein
MLSPNHLQSIKARLYSGNERAHPGVPALVRGYVVRGRGGLQKNMSTVPINAAEHDTRRARP